MWEAYLGRFTSPYDPKRLKIESFWTKKGEKVPKRRFPECAPGSTGMQKHRFLVRFMAAFGSLNTVCDQKRLERPKMHTNVPG